MAETKTILVAGATGQQGGTVARSLLKRGHRVIGLTRSASKLNALAAAGIEGAQGDLTQRASLAPLLRNVDGFFVVTTPFEPDFSVHPEKEVLQGTTAIDAAKAASVRHVVLSSVASADRNTGIPHFESKAKVEQYVRASRVPNTIVRPVAFMDNYVSPWMTSSLQRGIMEVPLPPTTRQQLVAVKDVGEFVARAFDDPKAALGKTVELAGDELAFGDLPAALSKKLGHPIRYVEQPEEEARKRMGDDGFRMFQFFKTIGYHVDIPALEAAWGYRMTRFQEFLDAVDWQRLGTGQWPSAPWWDRTAAVSARRRAGRADGRRHPRRAYRTRGRSATLSRHGGPRDAARSRGFRAGPERPRVCGALRSGPGTRRASRSRPRGRRCPGLRGPRSE